ncbi:MAG: HAD family hydrolase [Planctomycetota bacterium]|jgi:phosphoglycolate phosphatase
MSGDHHTNLPGVIFDLDGTLVDTLDDILDSINVVFAQADLAPVSRGAIRTLLGRGITNLLTDILDITDSTLIASLADGFAPVYMDRMLTRSQLYPGVEGLLDRLAELEVPMAILSNKPDEFTVPMCEALLDRWSFVRWRGARTEHATPG